MVFIVPSTNSKLLQLFESMVMFFGLCNSLSTFQWMMNSVFTDMLSKGWIIIYMDDILILSGNKKDHCEWTQHVLARLKQHNLYLKPEKCSFDIQEVEFLRLIICPNHLAMDPTKLDGIRNWKMLHWLVLLATCWGNYLAFGSKSALQS